LRPVLDLLLRVTTRWGRYATPGTPTVSNLQFEADAAMTVTARHGGLAFRVSYAPHILDIVSGPGDGTFVTQTLNLGVDVQVDPAWVLTFTSVGTYGTQSYLAPLAAPPGGVPAPPTPFPRSTSLESWSAAARAGATGRVSPVSTLRLALDASATSGIGEEDQLSLPPQATVRVEAAYDLRLSPRDDLSTRGYASGTRLRRTLAPSDGSVTALRDTFVTGILESWRHRPAPRTELALGLGGAWANSESTTFLSYGRLMPVAEFRVAQDVVLDVGQSAVPPERAPSSALRLAATLGYAPYVDPRSALVYERATASAVAEWPFQARWSASATLSTAMVPYRGTVAERYGNAEASVTYAPLRFASFQAGLFWNYQNSVPGLTSSFQAWGASFTIGLHEPFRI
jgi:hypothetical protein